MFSCQTPELQNSDRSLRTEWLECNGTGDYASGTITGCNSRRYHGLLVANLDHIGRHVLLSGMEDWLVTENGRIPLSSRKHPNAIYPDPSGSLKTFSASPYPTFVFEGPGFRLTRSLMLVRDRHTVLIRYSLKKTDSSAPALKCTLEAAPLLAFRGYHDLTHANMDLQVKTYPVWQGFKIQPYNSLPPFFMQCSGTFDFLPSPDWIYNVEYPFDQERGFDYQEDLFSPGLFEITLTPGRDVILSASTEEILPPRGTKKTVPLREIWKKEEKEHLRGRADTASLADFLEAQCGVFLIKDTRGQDALLAGYHWFGSWSRDALISLPGCAFLGGRLEEGMAVLKRITASISDGLIPNTFTVDGAPSGYDCIDSSLWYAWAVQSLLSAISKHRGEAALRKEVLGFAAPALYGIIGAYRKGHILFVSADESGFLDVGTPNTQLTWMNVQINGRPVTPRNGHPVEIEALWYNTLALAHHIALQRKDPDPCSAKELAAMRTVFRKRFLLPDGSLRDVWRSEEDGDPDNSVRPNQLFAAALPFPVLEPEKAEGVVKIAREKLLTPFGLRTLSPDDPAFCPDYAGSPAERGRSYHQGTVWPWLLGVYADALFKTTEAVSAGKRTVMTGVVTDFLNTISPLFTRHLSESCLGHISEIFSGTEPWAPHGSIAKAWSEAEVYRALLLARAADPKAYERWEKHLKWRND